MNKIKDTKNLLKKNIYRKQKSVWMWVTKTADKIMKTNIQRVCHQKRIARDIRRTA